MSRVKSIFLGVFLVSLLVATQVVASASETGNLRVINNEPGSVMLTGENPGVCGTWVPGPPPGGVAGKSKSAAFQLVVSPLCSGINVATFGYLPLSGQPLTGCNYKITGNGPFTFSATGLSGCAVVFDPQGFTDFVFPDTASSRTRTIRALH